MHITTVLAVADSGTSSRVCNLSNKLHKLDGEHEEPGRNCQEFGVWNDWAALG